MSSAEVREALHRHWPDAEYLKVEEAPDSHDRLGKKIDMLVLSLWASRGHTIDAVEIKVSMSDWKRELDKASKADFWWRHSHRFWVAVPSDIADKVQVDSRLYT